MLGRVAAHVRRAVALSLVAALAGCAGAPDRVAYTADEARHAVPVGFTSSAIRADSLSDPALARSFGPTLSGAQRLTYLALSGGGGDGAYGAGVLNGWTASGQRPTFSVVSGVSTGALIAPFAFLGPAYDPTLREIYTNGTAATLVQAPNIITGLFGSGLFGNRRLLDLVSRYLTDDMVAAIGREHVAGRRLFILTTNIDSQHGVVWNVGAIAATGSPGAPSLIRQIIAASASVPLAFSPILIDVTADGRRFQEMHVDGSVATAVFILPREFIARSGVRGLAGGEIYVLMNTSIEPRFSVVAQKTIDITRASFETLSTQKTIDNLLATYAFAKSNGIGFNLTSVNPADDVAAAETFDTAHMRKLFAIGVETASGGHFWQHVPPSVRANEEMARR